MGPSETSSGEFHYLPYGGDSPRGIGRERVTPKGDLSGSSVEYHATAFRFLLTSSQFTTFQKAPT